MKQIILISNFFYYSIKLYTMSLHTKSIQQWLYFSWFLKHVTTKTEFFCYVIKRYQLTALVFQEKKTKLFTLFFKKKLLFTWTVEHGSTIMLFPLWEAMLLLVDMWFGQYFDGFYHQKTIFFLTKRYLMWLRVNPTRNHGTQHTPSLFWI